MQGFPPELVAKMPTNEFRWEAENQAFMMGVAGNMVTLPVMLAYLMSTMCGVSWRLEDEQQVEQSAAGEVSTENSKSAAAEGESMEAEEPRTKRRRGYLAYILEPVGPLR